MDAFFSSLKELVYLRTGLKIDDGKREDVLFVLEKARQQVGYKSLDAVVLGLMEKPTSHALWTSLLDTITIGETYFFRNAYQMQALQQHVLPELIARRRASGFKHISIWSAGCATGEEPYTIAMLLRELLPDIREWTYSILATDINQVSLEYAKRGIYKSRSFRQETREDIQGRWFTPSSESNGSRSTGNGTVSYELDPLIRNMVMFAPLNLVSDEYPSFETRTMNIDILICRNVTIYFDEATTRQIVERFYRSISTDGWLVVGHAEPLVSTYRDFTAHNFENTILYQKQQPAYTQPAPKPVEVVKTKPIEVPKAQPSLPELLAEANEAANREDWNKLQQLLVGLERVNPMDAQVYYLRALMQLHTGDSDKATQSLRKAIYCDASFALAHYALGEMYEKRGNPEEARRCWVASQRAIQGRSPQECLSVDGGLTVEVFEGLLQFRLSQLDVKGMR